MPYSLADFKAKVADADIARENAFLLTMTPPRWARGEADITDDLEYRCSAAGLPGMSVTPIDHQPDGWGILDRRPSGAVINDITITFLLDAETAVLGFFQQWLDRVVVFNPDNLRGEPNRVFSAVGYREDYLTDLTVRMLNRAGEPVMTWVGAECWPSGVNTVTLSWDSQGPVLPTVTFQIRSWRTDHMGA